MYKYLNRKNLLLNLMTVFSLLIFIFFVSHIFFGERSLWKIFSLKMIHFFSYLTCINSKQDSE